MTHRTVQCGIIADTIGSGQEGLAMNGELMRMAEVAALVGVSVTTWRRWVQHGKAPGPVDLPGKPRWLRSALLEWLAGR